jgi:hypothetical protein
MHTGDMKLFLFLVAMANIMFVLGLLFSVQIKNMAALLPAFLSAALIFYGAYIEFNELPYEFVTNYSLGLVGIGYLGWGIFTRIASGKRPDKKGKAHFLLFVGAVGLAACYVINTSEWPLKLSGF